MGDRCYSNVVCAKKDQSCFEALGYTLESEEADALVDGNLHVLHGAVMMVDEQANYGHCDELKELAEKEGIPFLVENGPGDAYGDYVAASDGKRFAEHECLHNSAYPAARVRPDGTLDVGDLKSALHYWEVYYAAALMIRRRGKEVEPCKPS